MPVKLPPPYTTSGKPLFPNGDSTHVAPNTQVDLQRYQDDLKALTPGNQVQLINMTGLAKNFRNGYIESYTAGFGHNFRDFQVHRRVRGHGRGSPGRHLPPNSYGGADPHSRLSPSSTPREGDRRVWAGES